MKEHHFHLHQQELHNSMKVETGQHNLKKDHHFQFRIHHRELSNQTKENCLLQSHLQSRRQELRNSMTVHHHRQSRH
jgi:hypothetical protein